jgi:hypothetical protein
MSSGDSSLPSASDPQRTPAGGRRKQALFRMVIVPALILLGVFVLTQGVSLWREWRTLREELYTAEQHGIVGFLNIAPISSFIEWPTDWYRVDGKESFLWLGWEKEKGTNQRWIKLASGEIDPHRLQRPTYEFISQTIDFPLVETHGGKIWRKIPSDSPVVGFKFENRPCVYPVAVLVKVLVINDVVDKHPYMVVVYPLAHPAVAFSIYDAMLDGRRVTLAPTGYFQDAKPVLFDRGTESLWIEMHDGLTCMAGKHFKKRLMRMAITTPVTWSAWVSQNPESRLLVGANRSLGIPKG